MASRAAAKRTRRGTRSAAQLRAEKHRAALVVRYVPDGVTPMTSAIETDDTDDAPSRSDGKPTVVHGIAVSATMQATGDGRNPSDLPPTSAGTVCPPSASAPPDQPRAGLAPT